MKILETLIPRWERQKTGVLPGRTAREVRRTFAGRCAGVTSDVIALYSAIGGMEMMENDAFWRLWSLEEIVENNPEASLYGVAFSDHCLDCWCYRVKPEAPDRCSVYVEYGDPQDIEPGDLPVKIFDGLEEFFLAYAKNPNAIL